MNKLEAVAALPSRVPLRERLAAKLVLGHLARWQTDALTLTLPDGRVVECGNRAATHHANLTVRDWKFFWRALTAGDIGVGESYMAGEWDCDDLVQLCRLFLRDQSVLEARSPWTLAGARAARGCCASRGPTRCAAVGATSSTITI